mmetsp:Transcript_20824/g.52958  ORF Transcript_20824/g.52958 Transcript_20824/m.52958 type:complete len:266 (-) Transcript_20824:550-1347(-)
MSSNTSVSSLRLLFEGTSSNSRSDSSRLRARPKGVELIERTKGTSDDDSESSEDSHPATPQATNKAEHFVASPAAAEQASTSWRELSSLVEQVATGNDAAKALLLGKLQGMCDLLPRKVEEAAHLTGVLRELSHTRAEAIRTKVLTLESYHKLQADCAGLARATSLASAVSRANCGRATRLRTELGDARTELGKSRKQASVLAVRNAELRGENAELRARLGVYERALERLVVGHGGGGAGDAVGLAAATDCRVHVKPFPAPIGTY